MTMFAFCVGARQTPRGNFMKTCFFEDAWIFAKICDLLGQKRFVFFWKTLAPCVLGPWPRPRAFLSLASTGFVLRKSVLGLSLGFFCVLGPEPWVFDTTSDLVKNVGLELFPTEAESNTQPSRPRPRTQKNPRPRPRTDFSRTDLFEVMNRNVRDQGQRPRTQFF